MSDTTVTRNDGEVNPLPGNTLQYALSYARRGWPVLPLCWPVEGRCGCGRNHAGKEIGKAPLTPHGLADATTDPDQIAKWWGQWPAANVGIATKPAGLLVVDLDSDAARAEVLARGLPPSPVVKTGRGEQRYFRNPWPGMASATRKGDSHALDVLVSGYVVAPPSVHANGTRYRWLLDPDSAPLQDAPPWVRDLLRPQTITKPAELPRDFPTVSVADLRVSDRARKLIATGDTTGYPSRSEAGFAVIRTLIEGGHSDPEIVAVLSANPIGDYVRDRGPGWLAGEIGRARAKAQGDHSGGDPLSALRSLDGEADSKAIEGALRVMGDGLKGAGADRLRRETARGEAVAILEKLGVRTPARLVDAALAKEDDLAGRAITLVDPEPWPTPVDGAELLDEIAATFRRFMILPAGGAEALALWTVFSHCLDAFDVSPRLAFTSPLPRCGKTRGLTLLRALTARALASVSISAAVLFRSVERYHPTLLIDEADALFEEREELRAIVNAGHERETAFVLRAVGDEHDPRLFSAWCPIALALIGKLPATLEDRSIVLSMRRRTKREPVEPLRLARRGALEPLRRRAARWARDHFAALKAAVPDLPPGLHDRAQDNWGPLVAIADLAGGRWPELARQAAGTLAGEDADEIDKGDVAVRLLWDIRQAFGATARLPTAQLLKALHSTEDAPWNEWGRGQKPMTGHVLAKLLRRFGIKPRHFRSGGGYEREQFADAWERYLGGVSPGGGSPKVTVSQPGTEERLSGFSECHAGRAVTHRKEGQSPQGDQLVTDVTLPPPPPKGTPLTTGTVTPDDPSTWPVCPGCERRVPQVGPGGRCADCEGSPPAP